jgi:RimJ/RimL family protein N-acetyltransferase
VAYGFDVRRLDRILAMCDPANHASRRVMQKLGMVHLGEMVVGATTQVVELHELTPARWAGAGASFPDAE